MLHDYDVFSVLTADLPPLVRKQRRLEEAILPLTALTLDEKAVRAEIDALLITAGIQKGDGVTCLGYDVVHVDRGGTSRLNQETLIAQLVAAGVDRDLVDQVLQASTEVGPPFTWATVKPSKGAKVRMATAASTKTGKRRAKRYE